MAPTAYILPHCDTEKFADWLGAYCIDFLVEEDPGDVFAKLCQFVVVCSCTRRATEVNELCSLPTSR